MGIGELEKRLSVYGVRSLLLYGRFVFSLMFGLGVDCVNVIGFINFLNAGFLRIFVINLKSSSIYAFFYLSFSVLDSQTTANCAFSNSFYDFMILFMILNYLTDCFLSAVFSSLLFWIYIPLPGAPLFKNYDSLAFFISSAVISLAILPGCSKL